MTNVLTSWKEIAQYLGKGVRTVQRWEAEYGLPVRRPHNARHAIIALPGEIDAWVLRQTGMRDGNRRHAPPSLQQRLALLEKENARLRLRLAELGHPVAEPDESLGLSDSIPVDSSASNASESA